MQALPVHLHQHWAGQHHLLPKHTDIFYFIIGCVLPLQEVALRQSLPSFSVLCYPHPYRSLLPHNVISPTTFWSSDWSYTLYLPLCASSSPSSIFHSGDVSSPFPFCIGYILDYVCHSGSLLNGGVSNTDSRSVFNLFFFFFFFFFVVNMIVVAT